VDRNPSGVRARLRVALTDALKARDSLAISALRSAIAAIDNAETVDAPDALAPGGGSPHVAGAVSGLGAAEVPRRPLTEAEMDAIVGNAVVERRQAALGYEHDGDQDRASRLYAEAAVLRRVRGAFTEYAEINKLV
jgi:uncharacterized protein